MKTMSLSKPFDRLLFVSTLLLIFIMAARAPVDTDMWWALRAGKETWGQKAPYTIDTMSYTFEGTYWNSHSWLFDLLLYGCYAAGHYYGLTFLVAILAAGTMALVWLQIPGPALFRSILILFSGLVVAPAWTQRPQIITMLLLSFTCLVLFWYQRQQRDWLWALPPMMILWANLHAGYTLGLMAMGLVIAGEIADHLLFNNTEFRLDWFQIRKLILISIACGFAALLTPHGFGTWKIAFSTIGMQVNDIISEWTSPDFHQASMIPFLISLLVLLFVFGYRKKQIKASSLFTAVWFTYFSLTSRRHIAGYAITVMPILGRNLWPILKEWLISIKKFLNDYAPQWFKPRSLPKKSKENKWINLILISILGFLAAGKVIYAAHPVLMQQIYLPTVYPIEAIEMIKEKQYEGHIFNDYNIGGFLTWETPDIPVYVDARADLYGDDFLLEWLEITNGNQPWEPVVEKWNIGFVLIDPDRRLAQTLHDSDQWHIEYQSNQAVLYINNQITK